jgi:hypothetical protein
MKKTEGRKSRDTVPLRNTIVQLVFICRTVNITIEIGGSNPLIINVSHFWAMEHSWKNGRKKYAVENISGTYKISAYLKYCMCTEKYTCKIVSAPSSFNNNEDVVLQQKMAQNAYCKLEWGSTRSYSSINRYLITIPVSMNSFWELYKISLFSSNDYKRWTYSR